MIKMKKLLITLILALSTLSFVPAHADDNIRVYIDGTEILFDQPPVIQDGYTLVPMRALFEALGATVDWNAETQTVTGVGYGVQVGITIGESEMQRSMVPVPLDMPAQIINDRTMIPLRAVSESFGMDVQWDGENRVITLTDKHIIGELPWNDAYYYIGEIKDGKGIGYGELWDKETGKQAFIGLFDGERIVNGAGYYTDDVIYIGEFGRDSEGKNTFNGEGALSYSNGSVYVGYFKDGVRNGIGTTFFDDGVYCNGYFIDDKAHGCCTFYDANGQYMSFEVLYYGKTIDDCYKEDIAALDAETAESRQTIEDCYEEIEELSNNPLQSDIAQSVMSQYKYSSFNSGNYASAAASSGGNIDSFAAANAMRNQAALNSLAQESAMQAVNQRIETLKDLAETYENTLKDYYNAQVKKIGEKWDNIELDLISTFPSY
jgi:hypothetical protein